MAKHELVEQPTSAPTAKVQAAGLGGIAAALVLWGLDALDTVDLPTVLDSILPVIAATLAGYLKKARASER